MTLISKVFRNNKPLPKYLTDRKLKMLAVFIVKMKGTKKDKKFNLLRDRFFVMGGPIDIIFDLFFLNF